MTQERNKHGEVPNRQLLSRLVQSGQMREFSIKRWLQTLLAGDVLQLQTLSASVTLDEIYEDVEFVTNMAVAPVNTA